MIPDAVSFSLEFSAWKDKFNTKVRRATHNLKTWIRCLRLLLKGQMLLPKKIAIPEIFLYLFNPVVFFTFFIVTVLLLLHNPLLITLLAPTLIFILVAKKTRTLFVEVIQNNCFLLFAILSLAFRKQIIHWKTAQNPRTMITREMLENLQLI
jgi:hypothetical protein